MDYDKRTMAYIGVKPEKWDWFNKDYSQYPVETKATLAPPMVSSSARTEEVSVPELVPYVDPRPARAAKPALLAVSLIFLVLYVVSFVALPYIYVAESAGSVPKAGTGALLVSVIGGVAATCMALISTMCFSRRLWLRIPGLLLASIPALNLGTAISNQNMAFAGVITALIAGALIFGLTFSKSLPYKQRVKAPKTVYRTVLQEIPATYYQPRYYPAPGSVHGTPGGVAGATGKFNQGAINAGVRGEESTAAILKLLLKIPGTSVFHGLKFPESDEADVDHAVSHGNTVYLIDSKMFRTGVYEWDRYEEQIVSPGNKTKTNYMSVVADGYRKMVPYQVKVVPIVIVHGRNVSIGQNRWSPSGVGMFTAEEAMTFMGEQMSESMPTWSDNPSLRGTLIDNMKF